VLQEAIQSYGYWAILVGTFFEGETVLILAGFAAHQGYLSLPWVMACAFLGSLAGDQLYFYIGRKKGRAYVDGKPRWASAVARVEALLARWDVAFILCFRFLYGLRTVTPFVLGASRVSPVRFLVLNAAGAAVWAVAVGALGYVFGQGIEAVLEEAKRYEVAVFAGVAVVGLGLWFWRARRRPPDPPPSPPSPPVS